MTRSEVKLSNVSNVLCSDMLQELMTKKRLIL